MLIGTKKAKNATHRTQTGSTSASMSSNKTNWLPKGVKSYESVLFLKKEHNLGCRFAV